MRRPPLAAPLTAVAALLALAHPATAQRRDAATAAFRTPAAVPPPIGGAAADSIPPRAPLWAPLASAVVPGVGQAGLGQDRFVAYLAVEAFGWLRLANDLSEGKRRRREYRRVADEVARAPFSASRPVGPFEYYETMARFVESGVYDVDPGSGFAPEPDAQTYNGFVWRLARQTYWADPEVAPASSAPAFAAAIAFYEERAIRPEYRWSWRGAVLEQDRFRRTIARSNDAIRRSAADVGLILANHVLSAVDASVSVRVRRRRGSAPLDEGIGVEAALPWPARAR